MEIETEHHTTVSADDYDSLLPEISSTKESLLEDISLSGQVMNLELSNASEVLTKVELDFAFVSEKLVNLNLLTMQLGSKENDFGSFLSEKDEESSSNDSAEKALEFDLLSSILNSEVKELESLISYLQNEIQSVQIMISPFQHEGEAFSDLEVKLQDAEESWGQLMDQVLEMKKQSSNFQKLSSVFDELGSWSGRRAEDSQNAGDFGYLSSKINMQTADQQRNVLRMLEKSLAKEMELEKKLSESRNTERELEMKLYSSEQDVIYMEEVIEDGYSNWLEAENAAEVFQGISKEMIGKLQILQFNLSISSKREDDLKEAKYKLNLMNTENSKLTEKVRSDLSFLSEAESKCRNLEETNKKLLEELRNLREKQLRDSDLKLEHAIAAVEASKEKQNLYESTISDMEDVIEDLKSKVMKAEKRADYTEEKLIMVSESNAELNEELKFFRGKLKEEEKYLMEVEERKLKTAKEIDLHNKIMKKLVMQLADERERLHKQITNFSRENCVLMVKLKKISKTSNLESGNGTEVSPKSDQSKPRATVTSLTNQEEEETESKSDIGSVRRLDVGALGFNHILLAIFLILTSSIAFFISHQNI